jgi:uncharacterized membrane protein YgaE (UPF0421/DUF939 family)
MLTFFTITGDMMDELLGYVGDLFIDVSPILLLIVGVSLALMVITVIISSLRG